MRKTRRASKAKKLHDELVKKGKLGATVGGKRAMYTVAIFDDGKLVEKKDFSGDKFTLNDLMGSLGSRDEVVVKFAQEKYLNSFDQWKAEMDEKFEKTFGDPPFSRAELSEQTSRASEIESEIEAAILAEKAAKDDLAAYLSQSEVNHAVAEREAAAAQMHLALERYLELSVARELVTSSPMP